MVVPWWQVHDWSAVAIRSRGGDEDEIRTVEGEGCHHSPAQQIPPGQGETHPLAVEQWLGSAAVAIHGQVYTLKRISSAPQCERDVVNTSLVNSGRGKPGVEVGSDRVRQAEADEDGDRQSYQQPSRGPPEES